MFTEDRKRQPLAVRSWDNLYIKIKALSHLCSRRKLLVFVGNIPLQVAVRFKVSLKISNAMVSGLMKRDFGKLVSSEIYVVGGNKFEKHRLGSCHF